MNTYPKQEFLVETDQLAALLGDPKLRIIDATLSLVPDPDTTYRIESGFEAWRAGHIPGSIYVNIQEELSARNTGLRFSFPEPEHFARAVSARGVSNDSNLVIYATNSYMWATRLWFMFRAFGMQRVAILNGGLGKWKAEGRPLSTDAGGYPPGRFVASLEPGRVVTKHEVLGSLEDASTCVLNALSRKQHLGEGVHYGRPGRIKGSRNVPAMELTDPATGVMRPAAELRSLFEAAGALGGKRLITYCGGGIAATGTAFALALLGHEDKVALYDASLSEWVRDPAAPMEVG